MDHSVIDCVTPELDGGRYPVKRVVGDVVSVGADIVKEGHGEISARVLYRGPGDTEWSGSPMHYDFDTDRWYGGFKVDRVGHWLFTIEARTDRFSTWRSALKKKVEAGNDVSTELMEGAQLARTASRGTRSSATRASLLMTAKVLEDRRDTVIEKRVHRALDEDFLALMQEYTRPADLTRFRRELTIVVDRPRARFAAWYEMFPRSVAASGASDAGSDESPYQDGLRHGTFVEAAKQLPRIAELGFDVVYLAPIHPIGRSFRKGKNNSLTPEPDDVGSPWAIGNENGGHTAIEPALGTLKDFDRFVAAAGKLKMEVALDYALQCSPDHPWVQEHPEWFHVRADGSIKYAENPPKKYQDIYPPNFWCDDKHGLWEACRDVLLFWIGHGVKTFRVDNPHTKPLAFWEWVIHEVQHAHPEVIFFSEAFTRPKRMATLAKLGFTMSYTYFTWKNEAWDLREYFEELTQTPMVDYFRGNLFTNTPDILSEYLVHGGRSAFRARLLLAGTLLPLYGIYSGFELGENVPLHPGSEEYLDSEKYQIKSRDFDAAGNINDDIRRLNAIRRSENALQAYANLTFHTSENPAVLFYRKSSIEPIVQWVGGAAKRQLVPSKVLSALGTNPVLGQDILVVVNLDPHNVQETTVHVPIGEMGLSDDEPYVVHDLLTGARYTWRGVRNYIRLDPADQPGHVFRVEMLSA